MRRWAAVMAIVMAGFAVAAHGGTAGTIVPAAQRYAEGSPAMLAAQRIARATWGVDPCAGRVTIAWEVQDAFTNARSSWRNPDAGYAAADHNRDCRIVLNAALRFDWPKLCTIVVHEYGHLAGHPHSADPDDVMSPVYREPIAACAGARLHDSRSGPGRRYLRV